MSYQRISFIGFQKSSKKNLARLLLFQIRYVVLFPKSLCYQLQNCFFRWVQHWVVLSAHLDLRLAYLGIDRSYHKVHLP